MHEFSQPINIVMRSTGKGLVPATFEAGNWSMDADAATTTRIVEGNAQIARGLRR